MQLDEYERLNYRIGDDDYARRERIKGRKITPAQTYISVALFGRSVWLKVAGRLAAHCVCGDSVFVCVCRLEM